MITTIIIPALADKLLADHDKPRDRTE